VFFPASGLTKGDLIKYYLDLAPHLLHHVRRRPMQMLRYPDGVDGFRFYQKGVPEPHSNGARPSTSSWAVEIPVNVR
jgi:DNA primase